MRRSLINRRRFSLPIEGAAKRPKHIFRALVRKVIYNLPWLTGKSKKKNTINPELRSLLLKRVSDRTPEEMEIIHKLLGNYKYFRKYPESVQEQLSSCLYYWYVPAGKTIVRQGDPGYALYFIFSGECTIEVLKEDPDLIEEMIPNELIRISSGAMFGEVSLLHKIPRTATVTSESEVELLLLRIDDFELILKKKLEQEWTRIGEGLKLFPYFSSWTEIDIREFCMLSTIKVYKQSEIILGLQPNDYNYTYFILKGNCQVIQSLPLTVTYNKGKQRLNVLGDESTNKYVEIVFLQVCIFHKGSTISLGEDMKDRQVIAMTEVSAIRCPKYWLSKYNKANIWTRIENFLNTTIYPSRKALFKRFMEHKRWAQFREDLVNRIYMKRGATNLTTIHDVPMSIRVKEKIDWENPGFKVKNINVSKEK